MSLILIIQSFWQSFIHIFVEFLYAPFIYREILWILIPVLLAIILMELYFDRYPREGIGHHKSLENAIFLLFISFDLIRFCLTNNLQVVKIYLTAVFVCFVLLISILDFFHKLPLSIIYKTSSKFLIAYISYITIVLVYSDILDITSAIQLVSVLLAIICLLVVLIFVKNTMSFLEPKSYEEIEHFLKKIEDDIRETTIETDKGFKTVEIKHKKLRKRN